MLTFRSDVHATFGKLQPPNLLPDAGKQRNATAVYLFQAAPSAGLRNTAKYTGECSAIQLARAIEGK